MNEPTCPSCGIPYDKHLGLTSLCKQRMANIDYAIAHQRAIEAHCRGIEADTMGCHYHAKLLNENLRLTKQP